MDLGGQSQVILSSGLVDTLLDQFIKSAEVRSLAVLGVTLRLRWITLKGCDMGQELLVEQLQLLLLSEDVLTIMSHLFSL